MGIQGLLPALSPVTKAIHVKDYANKRVAIDGYSWLHKGAYSCSQELVLGIPTKNYINYFIGRVKMLMSYKIIPVVVFDGGPLPNKKLKEQERLQHREEYKSKGKAYLLEGNKAQAQTCFQKAVDITPKMAFFLIKELRRLNIEYLVAPYEADAQLTYLSITGQVDAIITEDSDLVAYGATQIILKMDKSGYAQEIKTEDLGSCKKDGYDFIDFNQTMIRHMCILSGCDYLPSLPGMGLKTSFKLLKQHRDIETVFRYLKREKPNFTAEYEQQFYKADFTFKHQRVYDPVTKTLTTLLPLDKEYPDPKEIDFIGPLIDDSIAERIALGIIDPETCEEFDPSLPIPKNTFNPQPKKSLFSSSKEFKNTGVNYDKLRNSNGNGGKNKILNDGKLVNKTGNLNDQFTFTSNKITQYISTTSSSITTTTTTTTNNNNNNTSSPIIEDEPNIDIDFDLDDEDDDCTPTKKMSENEEGVCESDNDYDDDDDDNYQPRGSSTTATSLLSSMIDKRGEKDAFVLDSDDEQEDEVKSPSFMFNNSTNNGNKSKKTLITSKFFSSSIVEESDNEDDNDQEDEDKQFQQHYQKLQQLDESQSNSLDSSIFRNEELDNFKYQPKNQKNFRNVNNNNSSSSSSNSSSNSFNNNKSGVFTKVNSNSNNSSSNSSAIKTTLLSSNDRVSLNFFDQFQFNGKKKQSILMSQSRKSLSSPSLSSNAEDYCSIGSSNSGSIPFNINQMTNEDDEQRGDDEGDDNFKIVGSSSSNLSNSQPLSISKNTFSNFLKRKSSSQTSTFSNNNNNNNNSNNNNNNNNYDNGRSTLTTSSITTTTTTTNEHSSYILKKSKYHATPDSSQNLNDQSFISKKAHSFSSLNSDLVFEDNEDLDNFIFQDNDSSNNNNNNNTNNFNNNTNSSSNNFKNNNIILTPKNNNSSSSNINNSNNILTSPPPPPSPYFNNNNNSGNVGSSNGNSNSTTPARFIIPTTSTPIYNNNTNNNNKIFSTPTTTSTSNYTPISTSISPSTNILTNTPNISTPTKQISPSSSNDIISKYFSSPIKIGEISQTTTPTTPSTPISLEGMSLRSRLSLRYQQTMAVSSSQTATNETK